MRAFMIFVIGLVFGAAGGFVIAAANGVTFDGHNHANSGDHSGMDDAAMGQGEMDHSAVHGQPFEVDAHSAPILNIMITKDPMAGYNLHVMTQDFTFAPNAASLPHVEGQGHAHVFVNGIKLGRLYGAWMHLDDLPKGEVEIEVSLNTNDHRPLAVNGTPISAKTTVTVD